MDPLGLHLLSLGATLLIELPIVAALCPSGRRGRVVAAALCANLASHSVASAIQWNAAPSWLALEAAVFVLEAAALGSTAATGWRKAVLLSLVANGASAGIAVALPLL